MRNTEIAFVPEIMIARSPRHQICAVDVLRSRVTSGAPAGSDRARNRLHCSRLGKTKPGSEFQRRLLAVHGLKPLSLGARCELSSLASRVV